MSLLRRVLALHFMAALAACSWGQTTLTRTLKICTSAEAAPEIKRAAESLRDGVHASPLLAVLAANGVSLEDCGRLLHGPVDERALHHLIVLGLPTDPMVEAVWQREALAEEGGFYVFGFGHLRGTLGYLESDRNPFLHSPAVKVAPYETELITVTGSNPSGVALAAKALLSYGLVNGAVAAPGWTRGSPGLLDRDPLTMPANAGGVELGKLSPATLGDATRIALTQAGESAYRDVLQDAGVAPAEIWLVKYYRAGAWDGTGANEAASSAAYLDGLHRRAFGNTLWIARFPPGTDTSLLAARIAAAAHLTRAGNVWSGPMPSGVETAQAKPAPADTPVMTLSSSGDSITLSTLPQPGPASQ